VILALLLALAPTCRLADQRCFEWVERFNQLIDPPKIGALGFGGCCRSPGVRPACLAIRLWWRASCSRRSERDVEELDGRFPVLEVFGKNAVRQGLDASYRFITILPVAQHAW
jgi:hypothetical protein